MTKSRSILAALALAALAACSSAPVAVTTPAVPVVTVPGATPAAAVALTPAQVTAQRTVFTAKTAYATALTGAVQYRNLPACSATQAQPCSDPAIVAQLIKADTVAAAALDAAEAAVRSPVVGDTARDRAVSTAQAALAALTAILPAILTR